MLFYFFQLLTTFLTVYTVVKYATAMLVNARISVTTLPDLVPSPTITGI